MSEFEYSSKKLKIELHIFEIRKKGKLVSKICHIKIYLGFHKNLNNTTIIIIIINNNTKLKVCHNCYHIFLYWYCSRHTKISKIWLLRFAGIWIMLQIVENSGSYFLKLGKKKDSKQNLSNRILFRFSNFL